MNFGTRPVQRRPRVFEPLQANSPFLDVRACTGTARQLIKSWGDGDAAPGSGDGGTAAVVVIALRKSLLTQQEKGADGHTFGGGLGRVCVALDTEAREKVSLWSPGQARGRKPCHRGVPKRLSCQGNTS